ncbi:hypothetical protein, partial [Comamonas guangdongensis]
MSARHYRIFLYAEEILAGAEEQLDERDREDRSALSVPGHTTIRDACFYLLGVLTGMRSSELSSIEVSAGRTEVKNGFVFHWVAAVEYKTKKGCVEYLMPAMGHRILRILERWSQPYRARLAKMYGPRKSWCILQLRTGESTMAIRLH